MLGSRPYIFAWLAIFILAIILRKPKAARGAARGDGERLGETVPSSNTRNRLVKNRRAYRGGRFRARCTTTGIVHQPLCNTRRKATDRGCIERIWALCVGRHAETKGGGLDIHQATIWSQCLLSLAFRSVFFLCHRNVAHDQNYCLQRSTSQELHTWPFSTT